MIRATALVLAALTARAAPNLSTLPPPPGPAADFVRDIQPLFAAHCVKCHGAERPKAAYRLDVKAIALTGGEGHAPNIVPGNSAASPLIQFVAGLDADLRMPPKGEPLSAAQTGLLRRWIDDGAVWPETASAPVFEPQDWWSLQPLRQPAVPGRAGTVGPENRTEVAVPQPSPANPIDAFLTAELAKQGLAMAPEADARTLCRRLYYDLIGLPPAPEVVDAFRTDSSAGAYERLVDTLLASPRYGERWARHWLDVVHYGETHGYDKDQPRPNAWPYRDYVIRAFNEDRPYGRFVQEQVAGDALFPGTRDGIEALGFLAAGPWDLIGHAEVPEEKIDGQIARHLDRDDMVANTLNTFCSVTVHCAQCHDHKFDPVSAEDYYSLQAVFAALDRADREYDDDGAVAAVRAALKTQQRPLQATANEINDRARALAGDALAALDKKIAESKQPASRPAAFGWHSALAPQADTAKWVQVDLGRPGALREVVLHACSDDFNGIGDGFGFPTRFKIEVSDDAAFVSGVVQVAEETARDFANPRLRAVRYAVSGIAQHVRVTATRLAPRQNDYLFALAELEVLDAAGRNLADGAQVTSLDSIEAPVRWARANLTDGYYPGLEPAELATKMAAQRGDPAKLEQARKLILEAMLGEPPVAQLEALETRLAEIQRQLAALPKPRVVYAGTIHAGNGAFKGTGGKGGRPRPIHLLARGDVRRPGREVGPGAIVAMTPSPARFELPKDAPEAERRASLARWLTDPRHPLTWRSIVNRVWQYHFGRGLVDTPNDFGRMGTPPSHPELLDWLAVTFRDDLGGSLKKLHRLIVTSAAYRQSSLVSNEAAAQYDSGNALLWRQNRRKLEAEALRDSVLAVAGKLDLTMGGPSFQDFVVTHPEHSPHYEYALADPEDPKTHRRSVYRFLVRSQQQPWMAALDCADPSMLVDKRNQTVSPLQALALLNNPFMVAMARHFAARLEAAGPDLPTRLTQAFRLALQRAPTADELNVLGDYAAQHGLANACRLLLNLNEFAFVD